MKIIDLLKNEKVCISCELFPPKAGTELQNALNIVSDIAEVGPHFMSMGPAVHLWVRRWLLPGQ